MKILDVGSGPIPKLVSDYVEVSIVCCDRYPNEWVELQDMEKLTYPDGSFDVVICINALDHTRNALATVKEMIRVAKHMVYIHCVEDQLTTQRKHHYWDAKSDGRFVNKTDSFDLKDYGFEIEYIPKPAIKGTYGQIIGTLCKTT